MFAGLPAGNRRATEYGGATIELVPPFMTGTEIGRLAEALGEALNHTS